MDAALRATIEKINSKLGEGTVVVGSEIRRELLPRCTTGSLSLDVALGGGWPMNQWNEVIGNESSGKTAIVLKTIAANQARDKDWTAVWFDAERSYDPAWAEKLGVENARTIVVTENGMETVYQTAIEFLASQSVDAVVIDSLPALVPEREDDSEMDSLQVGLGALLTGKFFRKQQGATKRSLIKEERPVVGIMINQWRDKIGVMYGDPRTTPGGRGKNFFYVTRLEVKRDEWIEEKNTRYGQTIKCQTLKNKTAVPHKTAMMDFYFDDLAPFSAGEYDRVKEIANVGVLQGIIRQTGGWYRRGEEQKWKGRQGLYDALRKDEKLASALEAEILAAALHKPVQTPQKRTVRRRG